MAVACDAIVIGGGAAGIAAARTLAAGGLQRVIILEARDRIGGRAYTSDELGTGVPLDHGGQWVHGFSDSHPMVKLARDLDVTVKPCSAGKEFKVFSNGQQASGCQEIVAHDAWKKMKKIIADAARGHDAQDCSCAGAIVRRTQLLRKKSPSPATMPQSRLVRQNASANKKDISSTTEDISMACVDPEDISSNVEFAQPSWGSFYGSTDGLRESITALLGQHANDIELSRSLLHKHIYFSLENYEGARIDRMSAKHGGDGSGLDGPNADVDGGYGQLVTELGKNQQTLFGRTVTEVLYTDVGMPTVQVTVRCVVKDGDADVHEQYSAPSCVVALPLGVLRDNVVKFFPPLPQAKTAAAAKLGVALMNKVELVWEKRWWPADTTSIVICALDSTPTYHPWPWFIEPPSARRHPLGWATLVCFLTGQFAEEVEGMSDADIARSAAAALAQAVGCDVPEPKAVNATKWGTDPFSRGSWTYFAMDSSCADVTALASPTGARGCVAFAGEHTCDGSAKGLDIGTIHGAWLSGEIAAKGLLNRIHTFKSRLFSPPPRVLTTTCAGATGVPTGRRCSYRHVVDQRIPHMDGYEKGAVVMVTGSPTEIDEEFQADPDEAPHIEVAQTYCSKKGIITERSTWGWLRVTFDDGSPPRWFTPFCLWLL